jgi:D-glycero-D-manno-heptose 1,7-bisphosphate phosphatase
MKRFVFLDRDGTLVRDVGYPHRLEDCVLLPGVVPGLQRLSSAGFHLAIVTNQSGIGRGLFTKRDFDAFQARLLEVLERGGIQIERTYVCPHAPEAGCRCRKPEPELLWRAREELHAELEASWVIGDSDGDVELARRAHCLGAVLLQPEEPLAHPADDKVLTAQNLEQAADAILTAEGSKAEGD